MEKQDSCPRLHYDLASAGSDRLYKYFLMVSLFDPRYALLKVAK